MSVYTKSNFKANYGATTGPFNNTLAASVTGTTLQTFSTDIADSVLFYDSLFDLDTTSTETWEYLGSTVPYFGWSNSGTGGGSLGAGSDSTKNAMGIMQLTTVAGVGYYSVYRGLLYLGNFSYDFRFRLQLANLSDGTNTYVSRVGMGTGTTQWTSVSEFTDGCFFRYTHSVNSGKWQAVTRSGGVETATDTGSTANTNYHTFYVKVNQAGTSVTFYIDGSLVATNTTNIPSTATILYTGWKIDKSAGGVANTQNIDWHSLTLSRSSAR